MARQKNTVVHQQIVEHLNEQTSPIEERVTEALQTKGEFEGKLTAAELKKILTNVLFTLIDEQTIHGIAVPIQHNVSQMEISIHNGEAHVACEAHIHQPITAFIQFQYILENDPRYPGCNLRLKNGDLSVKEVTRRFDIAAKTALKVMKVKNIAQKELSDPCAVIKRTLPPQLHAHGYEGGIDTIRLAIQPDNSMQVYLSANSH